MFGIVIFICTFEYTLKLRVMGTFFAMVGILAGVLIAPRFTLGVVLICFGWIATGIVCIVWSILSMNANS